MAGSYSDYAEAALLDGTLGGTNFTQPATVYVALFTARGTDTQSDANTNWTEVTGGSYARKAVTNNSTNWPAASGTAPTSKSNGTAITFVTATADWGTVLAYGVYDALTVGNLLFWATLTQNKTVSNGDTASFAIAALAITLD